MKNNSLVFIFLILTLVGCSHQSKVVEAPLTTAPRLATTPPLECHKKYNRKDWGQWRDLDKDCLKTRDEVLSRDSLTQVVIKNCKVKTGIWKDFYFGDEVLEPKKLEIDHVVPVKEAHETGGCHWSKAQKNEFYNDLENLVVATIKNNRSKSASDISVWQPRDKARACEQAKIVAKIKKKYGLYVKPGERSALQLLKDHGCAIKETY